MNTVSVWKRSVAIFLAALMIVGMIPLSQMMATETLAASGTTIYFKPSSNWKSDGARFAVYYWTSNGDGWVNLICCAGVYSAEVPSCTGFKFVRLNGSTTENNWDNKWNEWSNMTLSSMGSNNCYTMSGSGWDNGSGTWSTYTPPTQSVTVYLNVDDQWAQDTCFYVYYWADGCSHWAKMTATGTAGIYQAQILSSHTSLIFTKMNSTSDAGDWSKVKYQTVDATLPSDGKNMYTLTGTSSSKYTGTWGTYTPPTWNPVEGNYYYVDTDLVDYFNDAIAEDPSSTNNQSFYQYNSSQFAYINQAISGQGYTYPMYFGNLYSISNRYGWITDYQSLNNWYTAVNVALEGQSNAVIQGLVGSSLDQYGNLTDPETGAELFYFNQSAANTWKGPSGSAAASNPIMAYYDNLQFPFAMNTDTNGVTTYSYDSETSGYYVFFDKETKAFYTSDTPAYDNNKDAGFYPFNTPGAAHSEINHAFGTKFTIEFTVSDEGKIKIVDNDGNASYQDILFEFKGDDDVWVFIDDQLVLDMGGAHTMATGTINFATLKAEVTNGFSINAYENENGDGSFENKYKFSNVYTYWENNYANSTYSKVISDTDYDSGKTFNGERAIAATGKITTDFPQTLADAFQAEYDNDTAQVHTLTMFYMERGMFESNMSISFTISPLPSGLTVSKDIDNVNAGLNSAVQGVDSFDFSVNANNGTVTFDNYVLTDHNGVSTNMTTGNNTIVGVRGDKYASSFTNSSGQTAFTEGTEFVITESIGTTVFQYDGVKWSVYDADNGYKTEKTGSDSSAEFSFAANKTSNYALNFVNSMVSGSLSLKKIFADDKLEGYNTRSYTFTLKLDLDGDGTTFKSYEAYPNMVYTIDGGEVPYKTDKNGQFTLQAGQTATFEGIPAGAKYQIVETSSDLYDQTASTNLEGTIEANSTIAATITNATNVKTLNKTIYIVKGKDTPYTLDEVVSIHNGNGDIVTGQTLTVTASGNTFTVTGSEVGKDEYTYSGTDANGAYVSGTVTVYVYEATNEVYVFDFGLSSNLAQQTGSGLFEDGTYRIDGDGAVATLQSITGGGKQTSISFNGSATIDFTGKCSAEVTFIPIAFMSQVESYTYTVQITASGKTFDANDPETGCAVVGTIQVMPANTVYYEDNFNVEDTDNDPMQEIIFSANGPSSNPTLSQSNDQSSNYGYDSAYNEGFGESNGAETTLTNGQYAYFTFSGTGFDLISRTDNTTAGFAVYVFAGEHKSEYVDYMTSFTGATPSKMVFVDTYYNNGELYQVPVVSVRLKAWNTYTVYIQALATSNTLQMVSIDGIRIYDPLQDTSLYPLANEKDTTVEELRDLYGNTDVVDLAGKGSNGLFVGTGKQSAVEDALKNASIVENMEGSEIATAGDLESIYLHGPNNEMYLPYNFGIHFKYTVTSDDWTLQIGAKAVTASNKSKSFTVYVKNENGTYTDNNSFVVTLDSATDMYYDLTQKLIEKGFGKSGTYEIIIISNSTYENNEFVSLTTVKHSGVTLS